MAQTATAPTTAATTAKKWVYLFREGNASMRDLLGGKGAGLRRDDQRRAARPARLHHHHRGLQRLLRRGPAVPRRPVGPGARGPAERRAADRQDVSAIPANPLLVSVRSGAKFSMPGMMDTVLNLGLNDEVTARAWAR